MTDPDQLRDLTADGVLTVQPGDTLVIRLDPNRHHITAERFADIRAQLEQRMPDVRFVLIAADQLAVVKPEPT